MARFDAAHRGQRAVVRVVVAAAAVLGGFGCQSDSPTVVRDPQSLALRLTFADAAGERPVDIDTLRACAHTTDDPNGDALECTELVLPDGTRDFAFSLDVAPSSDGYRVRVDASGRRSTPPNQTLPGLLYRGEIDTPPLAPNDTTRVPITLVAAVPTIHLNILDPKAGTYRLQWVAIPNARRYEVIEEEENGATREFSLVGTLSDMTGFATPGVASRRLRYRVRTEFADGRRSAYSESIGVSVVVPSGGGLRGRVVDAGGSGLANVLATLWELGGAETGLQASSNADGDYAFTDLETGAYFVTLFLTGSCEDVRVPSAGAIRVEGATADLGSTVLACASSVFFARVSLTWGADPPDLDLQLWTPSIDGQSYHVFWGDSGRVATPPYTRWDKDDIDAYGPEVITIYRGSPGLFTLAVHHYCQPPGDGTLSTSGARVSIVLATDPANPIEITAPGGASPFDWWDIGTLDGTTGAFTLRNTFQPCPPLPSLQTCLNASCAAPRPRGEGVVQKR